MSKMDWQPNGRRKERLLAKLLTLVGRRNDALGMTLQQVQIEDGMVVMSVAVDGTPNLYVPTCRLNHPDAEIHLASAVDTFDK